MLQTQVLRPRYLSIVSTYKLHNASLARCSLEQLLASREGVVVHTDYFTFL